MNKFVLLLLGSLFLIPTQVIAAVAPCWLVLGLGPECDLPSLAVEVTIGSIDGEIDDAAISTVKQVVGHAVATGVVVTFVRTSMHTAKGEFSFCAGRTGLTAAEFLQVIDGIDVEKSQFQRFIDQLKSIQPHSGMFYNIDKVNRCPVTIIND